MLPGLAALSRVNVQDSCLSGVGTLLAARLGLFTVAEAQGGGELARGELICECRVSSYEVRNGMMVPTIGEAAWVRPEGRKPYFIGKLISMVCEFSP